MGKLVTGLVALITSFASFASSAEEELKCMKDVIYHEARGEGIKGQIAVANVVMHRVRSSRYRDTVCGVVYQPWAFSWTMDSKLIKDIASYPESIERIARQAIEGNLKDVTRKATHFHTISSVPRWDFNKLVTTAIIGNHVFYRYKRPNE